LGLLPEEVSDLIGDFLQSSRRELDHPEPRSSVLRVRAIRSGLIPKNAELIGRQSVNRHQIRTVLTNLEKKPIQDQIAN
jgi:hypothetical protein